MAGYFFCSKLLFSTIIFVISAKGANTVPTVKDYVIAELEEAKNLLYRTYLGSDSRSSATIDTGLSFRDKKWVKLWDKLWESSDRPRAVDLSADRLLLVDDKLLVSIPYSNYGVIGRDVQLQIDEFAFNVQQVSIRFIKSYSWKDFLFLLVCEISRCSIYYGASKAFNLADSRQLRCQVQYDGFLPVDASFFLRGDKLWLVVLFEPNEYNGDSKEYPSRLYQWTGANMEAVAEISTPHPARSVATFSDADDQSTIFLYSLQRNRVNELAQSVNADIYELNSANVINHVNSLLGSDSIASIRQYSLDGADYIIFTYDSHAGSAIFERNGSEFKKLADAPEIKSANSVSVVTSCNRALLFSFDQNSLEVYQVSNRGLIHLKELSLENEHVHEIAVVQSNASIFVVLIKHSSAGTYCTEFWQLPLYDVADCNCGFTDDVSLNDCFKELKSLLDNRASIIEKQLKEANVESPIKLSNVILDEEDLPVLEFDEAKNKDFLSPLDLKSDLEKLDKSVETVSSVIVEHANTTFFSGNTLVDGDARVTNLIVDYLKVDQLNDQTIDTTRVFLPGLNQTFLSPLQANVSTIYIDDLHVSSICGIDHNYWLRINDENRTKLYNDRFENILISNDTVIVKGEVATFSELNVNFINGTNMNEFLENAFIIGQKQIIKGNINCEHVEAKNLNANQVNNKSSTELITKYTNQSLSDVYVDSLLVQHLVVEKINGVPVDNAAKMSVPNVIKGKVTISNFIVADELTVDKRFALPLQQSTQVYEEIRINGDVFVKNLEIEGTASLFNVETGAQNVNRLLDESWSKSRSQTIQGAVTLARGASIDELSCEHLNGLGEHDFLYVNDREMEDLENVTFASIHLDKVVNESSGSVESFFEESDDALTFHKAVRLSHLSVDNVNTDGYNGIPIETIMRAGHGYSLHFPDATSHFQVVRVQEQMFTDELLLTNHINSLQGVSALFGPATLKSGDPVQVDALLNATILNANNLQVTNLCGKNLDETLIRLDSFYDSPNNLSLTIIGQVEVDRELKVNNVNGEKVNDYVENLKAAELVDVIAENQKVKTLRVKENLNVTLLNGYDVRSIFSKALTISHVQDLLASDYRIKNAYINHLDVNTVNGQATSNLIFVNRPIVLRGNVSFEELLVRGNTTVKTANGQSFEDLVKITGMQTIPLKHATSLHISGQMMWDNPSLNLHSVGYLLKNAVTKHETQWINCSVNFLEPISVKSLYLQENDALVAGKLREIISDSVLDGSSEDSMLVRGTKIFKKNLITDDLEVVKNIDVKSINEFDVDEITSQIYQKNDNQTILPRITFDGEVVIGDLITNNTIHGIPLFELATIDKTLPDFMHFDDLSVNGNVTLHKLDGIDFESFKKQRVTLDGDCDIINNVTIVDPVHVLDQTFVSSVNGIRSSDFVVNTVNEMPAFIRGNKIFSSNLVVEGNVTAALVNNFNIIEIYNRSYSKYENVHISNDMIFDEDVEISSNMYISGLVNGLHPEHISEVQSAHEKSASKALNEEKAVVSHTISHTDHLSSKFAKDVKYIEQDSQLRLYIPGAKVVRSMQFGSLTVLDIHTMEAGNFCGLPKHCVCRRQRNVKIFSLNNYTMNSETSAEVRFNLYFANYLYGLQIISSAVSNSENCSLESSQPESSKIFWMRGNNFTNMQLENLAAEIQGYISDVQTFIFNHKLYVILAIFYDKTNQSHTTKSLLYKFDLQNKSVDLVQMIPTEGVKSIHVFQINHVGIHLVIGCVKGKAETLLYRFHPEIQEFQFLRSFGTGGSKNIASINTHTKSFIILSNPDIEALQIFSYSFTFDNFYDYQNLYYESKVTSLNVFYPKDFGNDEAFIFSTTKDGWFYVYEYTHFGKFKLKLSYWIEDIQVLAPFKYIDENYLFAGSKVNSTIFKIIQQGLYYH